MRVICVYIILIKLVCSIKLENHGGQHTKYTQAPLMCSRNGSPRIESKRDLENRWKTAFFDTYRLRLERFMLKMYIKFNNLMLKYYLNQLKQELYEDFNRLFNRNKESTRSSNYPLVGNTWVVEFEEAPKVESLNNKREKMEFFDEGTVVASSGLKGNWWTDYGDLVWKFPVKSEEGSYVYFSAQFYVNKLDKKPYMRRGVVFKDRSSSKWLPKSMFRPVVSTFKAYCI
ncbi:hypothetical protein MACJ_003373 [Theileria orientalis]|uniref:Uncharacterized protein n=1 Tax=Theileria orientalis TaxID=68886 RepID=A0A976SK42_THEOR|nr:hypothetical protein MACJ_003373 [Theileria orientalis]